MCDEQHRHGTHARHIAYMRRRGLQNTHIGGCLSGGCAWGSSSKALVILSQTRAMLAHHSNKIQRKLLYLAHAIGWNDGRLCRCSHKLIDNFGMWRLYRVYALSLSPLLRIKNFLWLYWAGWEISTTLHGTLLYLMSILKVFDLFLFVAYAFLYLLHMHFCICCICIFVFVAYAFLYLHMHYMQCHNPNNKNSYNFPLNDTLQG